MKDIRELIFRKNVTADIEFDLLVKAIRKYKSIHINRNIIRDNLIDLDFVYDERSLNSTKCLNAKIIKSIQYRKKSILQIKFNVIYLIFVFVVLTLLVSIIVFDEGIQLTTGIIVLIVILTLVYLLLRYFFEQNIRKLISELKQLIINNTT